MFQIDFCFPELYFIYSAQGIRYDPSEICVYECVCVCVFRCRLVCLVEHQSVHISPDLVIRIKHCLVIHL